MSYATSPSRHGYGRVVTLAFLFAMTLLLSLSKILPVIVAAFVTIASFLHADGERCRDNCGCLNRLTARDVHMEEPVEAEWLASVDILPTAVISSSTLGLCVRSRVPVLPLR